MNIDNSDQDRIDVANARFWSELCGTGLADHIGIADRSVGELRRFDDAYLAIYPYLLERVPASRMANKRVLEVGLGYGTLGQKIAERAQAYVGLDIASGPVEMMQTRLRLSGLEGEAIQGNILDSGLPSADFDVFVSVGCLHHTGNLERAINEAYRVLRPGGEAYIMLYNKFSLRAWTSWPAATARSAVGEFVGRVGPRVGGETERKAYDASAAGRAAPETVFVSRRDIGRLFSQFSRVSVTSENSDPLIVRGRVVVARETMLKWIGPILGLDLYISAVK